MKAWQSQRSVGSFGYYNRYQGRLHVASEITLSIFETHPEHTLNHEIGRFLDYQAIGNDSGYSSKSGNYAPMNKLLDSMMKSDAVNNLKATKNLDKKYYFDKAELVARSYAPYIATKSSDPLLVSQLNEILQNPGEYKYSQWTNADFIPIMKM